MPTRIWVFYRPVVVEWVEKMRGDNGDPLYGEALLPEDKILLSREFRRCDVQETLLHEIVHFIGWDQDLRLKERQVRQLSLGLFEVLKKNPRLVKWMVG